MNPTMATVEESAAEPCRPEAKPIRSRWRVDCSCGWHGPVVTLLRDGYDTWMAHFRSGRDATLNDHDPKETHR